VTGSSRSNGRPRGRRRRGGGDGGGGRCWLSASFSAFAFAPSFACHSTLASNFLHAIARYWNCLVGDLSPSVIYFLNRSYLPACLACPFVRNFVRPIRVCTRVRAHAAPRNFPTSRDRFAISRLGISSILRARARLPEGLFLPADLETHLRSRTFDRGDDRPPFSDLPREIRSGTRRFCY